MMKKTVLIVSAAILSISSINTQAQFSFGVSPGLTFNSSYFGYKMGKVLPYVAFQHAGLKVASSISSRRFNFNTNAMEDYTDETDIGGNLFLPSLGAKFFLIDQDKLKGYANVMVTKPIIGANYSYNGAPDTLFDKTVEGINLWGGELGFGVEYAFDSQFSIGGEFGLRPILVNSKVSDDIMVFNPNTGMNEPATRTYTNKANYNLTYAKLTLNFYFNKKATGGTE